MERILTFLFSSRTLLCISLMGKLIWFVRKRKRKKKTEKEIKEFPDFFVQIGLADTGIDWDNCMFFDTSDNIQFDGATNGKDFSFSFFFFSFLFFFFSFLIRNVQIITTERLSTMTPPMEISLMVFGMVPIWLVLLLVRKSGGHPVIPPQRVGVFLSFSFSFSLFFSFLFFSSSFLFFSSPFLFLPPFFFLSPKFRNLRWIGPRS